MARENQRFNQFVDRLPASENPLLANGGAGVGDILTALKNLVAATNANTEALQAVLAVVQTTATTATAGGTGALPATVKGYLSITLPNGSSAKVPYYDP